MDIRAQHMILFFKSLKREGLLVYRFIGLSVYWFIGSKNDESAPQSVVRF